jgi:hypothetical protein
MPRKDLHVVLAGVQIKPGLALGSWAAFKRVDGGAMVMGDLVLTEDELEPVMMKLQEEGIHESAVHNHLMGESPRILYMHIASHGDAVAMAKAIHDALALTKTPAPDNAAVAMKVLSESGHESKIYELTGPAALTCSPQARQQSESGDHVGGEQASRRLEQRHQHDHGPSLPFPYSSGIATSRHRHMRELRIQHEGRPYRVLYAFDPRRAAILLLGGDKTGNDRWYDEHVPNADTLYDEYLRELEREGLT